MIMKMVRIAKISSDIVVFQNGFSCKRILIDKLTSGFSFDEIFNTIFLLVLEKGIVTSIGNNNGFLNLDDDKYYIVHTNEIMKRVK